MKYNLVVVLLLLVALCEAKLFYFGAPTSNYAASAPFSIVPPSFVPGAPNVTSMSCGKEHCLILTSESQLLHFGSYIEYLTAKGDYGNPTRGPASYTTQPKSVFDTGSVNPVMAGYNDGEVVPAPAPGRIIHFAAGGFADWLIDAQGRFYARFLEPNYLQFVQLPNITAFFQGRTIKMVKTVVPFDAVATSGDGWSSTLVVVTANNQVYTIGGAMGLNVNGGNSTTTQTDCPLIDGHRRDGSMNWAVAVRLCQVSVAPCLARGGEITDVTTGQDFVVLHTNEGLCGWGSNAFGTITNPASNTVLSPQRIQVSSPLNRGNFLQGSNFLKVVSGPNYVLARVVINGTYLVIGWGRADSPLYELGRVSQSFVWANDPAVIYQVPAELNNMVIATAGRNSLFCYTGAGYSSCYGLGFNAGALGTGTSVPSSVLRPMPTPLAGRVILSVECMKSRYSDQTGWSAIACFAVDESFRLISWGDTREGKIGYTVTGDYRDVSIPTNTISTFASTRYAAAFVARDGLLYTVGANDPPGILGVGATTDVGGSSVNIVGLPFPLNGRVGVVAAGEGFFAVLLKGFGNDDIAWWGNVPTASGPQTVPTRVSLILESPIIDLLACGRAHCAIVAGNFIVSWGFNHIRQIANNGLIPIYEPENPYTFRYNSTFTRIVQLVASDSGNLFLTSSGDVVFWGTLAWNYATGAPQTVYSLTSPLYIARPAAFFGSPVTNIYAGFNYLNFLNTTSALSFANDVDIIPSTYFLIRANNGTLYGFGYNTYGVLGLAVTLPYAAGSPQYWTADLHTTLTPILPSQQFSSKITAGATAVYAQLVSGDIVGWGYSVPMGGFPDLSAAEIDTAMKAANSFASTPNHAPFPRFITGPWQTQNRNVVGLWGRYSIFFETSPRIRTQIRQIYVGTPVLPIDGIEFGEDALAVSVVLLGLVRNTPFSVAVEVASVTDTSVSVFLPDMSFWDSGQEIRAQIAVNGASTALVPVARLVPPFAVTGSESVVINARTKTVSSFKVYGTNFPFGVIPTLNFTSNSSFAIDVTATFSPRYEYNSTTLTFDMQFTVNEQRLNPTESFAIFLNVKFLGVASSTNLLVATGVPVPTVSTSAQQRIADQRDSAFVIEGSGFVNSSDLYAASRVEFSDPAAASCFVANSSRIECSLISAPVGGLSARVSSYSGYSDYAVIGLIVDAVRALPPRPPRNISSSQPIISIDMENWSSGTIRPRATLRIITSKRAVTEIPCNDYVPTSSGTFLCTPSMPLVPGSLSVTLAAYGTSNTFEFGQIVSAPVVTASTTKYASSGAYQLVIRGNFFTSQNFGEETAISFTPASLFTINRELSNDSALVVSFTAPVTAGPLLAVVSANGGSSGSPVQVASIVSNPTVTTNSTPILNTETQIVIFGANFHEDPQQNSIVLTAGDSELPCTISSQSTTSSIICVNLNLSNFTSATSVFAKVSAYQSFSSSLTQVAIVGPRPDPNNNANGGAQGLILDDAAKGGIGAGVVGGVLLLVLIAVLVARWQIKAAERRNAEKMKKMVESKLKEMQMEMKDVFKIKTSDLTITTKLGEGSYGAVYLALWKKRHVAVKKLTSNVMGNQVSEFFREASLMISLKDHPNIVKVYGMCQEAGNFQMVMEFLPNGSLDSWLANLNDVPSEAFIWTIARGTAAGMASLASQGIVHRDLAARNILLGSDLSPKVADFGYARVVSSAESVGQTTTTVGPIRWMSPESIRDRAFSEKTDVWSYACMLFELIAREEPFRGMQLMDVAVTIRDTGANPGIPPGTPSWLGPVMEKCWSPAPESRPHFAEIVAILDAHRPSGALLVPAEAGDATKSVQKTRSYENFGKGVVEKTGKKKGKGKSSAETSTEELEDDRYMEMI